MNREHGDGTKEKVKYRAYLNGDCFLVGYEFTIGGNNETGGVYVIGSVHGDDNSTGTKDVPMEIVHFSVSGTAQQGGDGVTGNQLGAIDFVYDDPREGGSIITIGKTGVETGLPNTAGTEDFSAHYASHCMIYTDFSQQPTAGTYVKINQATLSVRRYLQEQNGKYESVISYKVGSSATNATDQVNAITCNRYTGNSDIVFKNGEEEGG